MRDHFIEGSSERYPLTQTQMGIYLECAGHTGEICYNIPHIYTFSKGVDMERLAQAIERVVAAHSYLLSRIEVDDSGDIWQVKSEEINYAQVVEKIDDIESVKPSLVKPFDLNRDALFRIRLFSTPQNNYLFFDIHHIIFDAYSCRMILSEISRAYDGELIADEEFTGFDVAIDELERRESEEYCEAKLWHERSYDGVDVDSSPIVDQKLEAHGTGKLSLSLRLKDPEVKAFCKANGVGRSAFFNAAFAYFLAAYNNSPDALYTTVYAGRGDERTRRTLSMMVKTLVIYQDMSKISGVTELVQSVAAQLSEAMKHDIYSFVEASAHLGVTGSLMFAYQGDIYLDGAICGEPAKLEDLRENIGGETLQLYKSGEDFYIECEYRRERYSDKLIEDLLQSFDNLLCEMLTKERLSDISLVAEGQMEELDALNQTAVEYDKSLTIIDLIGRRVAESPDSLAVVYQENSYSYRELGRISDNIANNIASRGLGSEDVVAILIPRSEFMAIAPLGVVKSGATYQPLDHTYPTERLEFMLADSGAKLLIADEALLPLVPNYSGEVLLTSDLKSLPDQGAPSLSINVENAFNLLYTSGSTGLPKGCIIEHRNIAAFVHLCRNIYGLTAEDNTTAYASFGFDASMWETFMSLCWGCTLHIIAEDIRLNLIDLETYFVENNITVSFMTTQVGRQFALSVGKTNLRHFSTGGEKLAALDPPSDFTLHNCYGPTEATVFVTHYPLVRKESNIPIGKTVENVKSYIVNSYGQRQPIGGVGELWVAGEQVARGYLNRPEVTEKVFISNPFTQEDGYQRVYRTGDIVRYLPDGNIEFIGRRDAQVKIRGFRIELTEVESIIREFPSVKDVTVQAYDMEGGGKYIAAFIVGDERVDIEALKEFVLENKPPYILPAAIMQIDAIPLTQNQKVNKKALPEPEIVAAPDGDEEQDANRPLNILEEEIKKLVCEVTNTEHIGLTTKFIYAGLTSITSIKLATLLYKRFDINIDTKSLSKEYSILDVENVVLARLLAGKSDDAAVESQSVATKEYYPLSYSQLGVYYECVKNPLKTTYNIPLCLRYPKSVAVADIVSAVRKIIDMNPYLLCRFETHNAEVVQRISREDYDVAQLVLSEAELDLFKQSFVKPYNLQKDTLFRIACVEGDEANYLFMDFHHLIFDGASCDLFIAQLNRVLSGDEMEGSGYSYFNYIDDEQEAETSDIYRANEEYFASRLQLCEGGTEIPVELNKSADNAQLAVEEIVVTSGDGVEAFCRSHAVSPAQFYLAASLYTISRFANTKDLFISTISNGRSNIKTAYTYGMMVKTLPIASFVREQSVGEYIIETARDMEETIDHENYPYAKLAADYHFSPEIMYAYQVGVITEYKVGDEAVGFEALGLKSPKFKLSIHIESREGRDAIVLEYNDALYSSCLMSQLAMSLDTVVSNFIGNKDALLKSISIVSEQQQAQLDKFHSVAQEMGHISYYHSGLERFAQQTPSNMALVAKDAQYSYGELNAEANKVANALIARGVAIGDRVAILLPRTSRLIISMYGVSKSGAAYIPCDVEYPKERIDHVLSDSNAKYVITTKDRVGEFESGVAVDVAELLSGSNVENPNLKFGVDELAYIIYTSGSTGKPKGVLLMHKGISNYTFNHPCNRHVHALVCDATKYLSVTTISFDMSLKEIAITVANGLTLILADENEANNPILLTKLFEQTGADAFNATPSRVLQYMEYDGFCEVLSRCKIIMSGGEKFSAQLLSRLHSISKGRIFNTYGPTEITVSSNARELTNESVITIGQPLLNYIEFVVDSDGNELPPCVVGELYIGGVGVAKGYNNLEEMTKERFITYNGIEVYRSGDYAAWDKMGNVSILGRTDNQVKLRGLRIELGEIESAISKFDGVKSVVAIIKEIKGKEHIAAYYTASVSIDVMELKEQISKGLAAYMVPTAYLQLDAMPQTPNGKTDVKSLPVANLLAVSGGEQAANSVEQVFCDMFASILSIDQVGATDNFFEIGGSSLVATRLIIESSKLGYDVAYGDIFEHPTPRELALLVGGAELESDKSESDYEDIDNFDYSHIQSVLEANTLENFQSGELRDFKRVLLTGTTGFLGIHILKELLDREGVTIYCLLRGRDGVSAEQRLKTMLFYYFEQTYEELLSDRLFVLDGDFGNLEEMDIPQVDMVVNCAAIVKHFAKGNEIYDVNVTGVEKLIELCVSGGARLIHVSTMSVNGFATYPQVSSQFKEQELYKGQYINNKYIHSKFLAERAILDSIAQRGLDAKIMRVGNLSARNSDGEFQINFNTNSFMNRLKVFNVLGVCPYEELDSMVEFSPIDEVAHAILLLSTTPKECCVFHPYNNHSIFKGDIFMQMSHLGINVRPVEVAEYLERIDTVKSDVEMAQNLTSIIAYENMGNGREITPNIKSNSQTMQILYRMNYRWPVTSWDYIERFVEGLLGFGYFNE